MKCEKKNGKLLMYCGFSILGAVLFAIYGFVANRFQISEIFLLIIGGIICGIALGLICNGIINLIKK